MAKQLLAYPACQLEEKPSTKGTNFGETLMILSELGKSGPGVLAEDTGHQISIKPYMNKARQHQRWENYYLQETRSYQRVSYMRFFHPN